MSSQAQLYSQSQVVLLQRGDEINSNKCNKDYKFHPAVNDNWPTACCRADYTKPVCYKRRVGGVPTAKQRSGQVQTTLFWLRTGSLLQDKVLKQLCTNLVVCLQREKRAWFSTSGTQVVLVTWWIIVMIIIFFFYWAEHNKLLFSFGELKPHLPTSILHLSPLCCSLAKQVVCTWSSFSRQRENVSGREWL